MERINTNKWRENKLMIGNRMKTKIIEKADQLKYQRTEDMMGDTKGKYKTGR